MQTFNHGIKKILANMISLNCILSEGTIYPIQLTVLVFSTTGNSILQYVLKIAGLKACLRNPWCCVVASH